MKNGLKREQGRMNSKSLTHPPLPSYILGQLGTAGLWLSEEGKHGGEQ